MNENITLDEIFITGKQNKIEFNGLSEAPEDTFICVINDNVSYKTLEELKELAIPDKYEM